jgi:dephospho-CoA kinase
MPQPGAQSTVIGVLGGIASGKSLAARLLAGPAGVVIDADRIAREVLDEPASRAFLREAFGAEVLDAGGRVDRDALAARVFRAPAERQRLEGFTHPLIRARIRAALDGARADGRPRIVLDVPLLLENESRHHLLEECDTLVFVDAELAQREARARERRGWQPGELARREAAQLPLSTKKARADHVLSNDGTQEELEQQVARLVTRLGLA